MFTPSADEISLFAQVGGCTYFYIGAKVYITETEGKIHIPYGPKGEMLEYVESERCRRCPTKYEIKTTKHFATGWNLSITAYGLLGECRSNRDPVWVHMRDHSCGLYSFNDGEPKMDC